MSIVIDMLKGKLKDKSLRQYFREPDAAHHAIVGAISFAFIAAAVVASLPGETAGGSAIMIGAAVAGSLFGKLFVI